jgi:hypothetical protein
MSEQERASERASKCDRESERAKEQDEREGGKRAGGRKRACKWFRVESGIDDHREGRGRERKSERAVQGSGVREGPSNCPEQGCERHSGLKPFKTRLGNNPKRRATSTR